MKLKTTEPRQPEINVGSFADIAFLLIIFFILTTQFLKPAGAKLQMPAGTEDKKQQTDQQLTISLSPGLIRYGQEGRRVTFDELRAALEEENFPGKEHDRDRIVIIDSTDDVPYEQYYRVIMAVRSAGGVLALLEQEGEKKKKEAKE